MIKRVGYFGISLFTTFIVHASPVLDNIGQDDLDALSQDFSANYVHSTVSPPHAFGDLWGVEVGLIGGITRSKRFNALVQEINPANDDYSLIPHGALTGSLTLPWNLTVEGNLFPKVTISNVSAKSLSMGLKWSFSELFSIPLIKMALKGHFSSSKVTYAQLIQNNSTLNQPVDSVIVFDNSVLGLSLSAGFDLPVFEPFLGVGVVRGKTDFDINANGNATIFENSVSLNSNGSASSKKSSLHLFSGLQFDFSIFHLSAAYMRVFDTDRYTGKMAIYF